MTKEKRWISVFEKLPPEDCDYKSKNVLITDGEYIGFGYYEYPYYAEDPEEEIQISSDKWHDIGDNLPSNYLGNSKVTHWMKLPELPYIFVEKNE